MVYIVYYVDDFHKKHIAFVKSFKEVKFFRERFGEITVEPYKVGQNSFAPVVQQVEQQICNLLIAIRVRTGA